MLSFTAVCAKYGTKLVHSRPRHPQAQGLVERANGMLKAKINAWCHANNSTHWAEAIAHAVDSMN